MVQIEAKSIKSAQFFKSLPIWRHLYATPLFSLVYPFLLNIYSTDKLDRWFSSIEYFYILVGIAVTINALLFLSCHWSVFINSVFCYQKVNSISDADQVLIVPSKKQYKAELVKIQHRRIQDKQQFYLEFQKKKFVFDGENDQFVKVRFPTTGPSADYLYSFGLNKDQIKISSEKYGKNVFEIPIPSFQELFKEHAVAPFFVFQIFCVALWFMDEYWYYSLFTLAMLFVFESTVVFQRLRNMKELRSMTQPPIDVYVFRDNTWTQIKSNELLPGDLISVNRGLTDDTSLPCDILLLHGRAIVNEALLTGESTPIVKEALDFTNQQCFDIKDSQFRINILFGGTKVLQALTDSETSLKVTLPPDNGCIGYVLRTGFGTTQGKLVRTMIFSTDRVSANNIESLFFILFLLIFAIAASYHVWVTGIENGRKKSKLILDCIMILTSVVPPELPMELSLAVNQSLMALSRKAIFCLEPFRIPFAGKIDVCCFDKTGTLTEENLKLEGIGGLIIPDKGTEKQNSRKAQGLIQSKKSPPITKLALASCHSIMHIDEKLVGDPLEIAVIDSLGYEIHNDETVKIKDSNGIVKILRKYPFSSSLKRMACVSQVLIDQKFFVDGLQIPIKGQNRKSQSQFLVSVKGAPEVLRSMYESVPENYDQAYTEYAKNGSRVLAIGFKWVDQLSAQQIKNLDRAQVESNLQFAGFLVFNSPLKKDTLQAIEELQESMHRIIMITGDNPLTASFISDKLRITQKNILILETNEDGKVYFHDINGKFYMNLHDDKGKINNLKEIISNYHLCCTGSALEAIHESDFFTKSLLHRIWVYARTSPSQKELILNALKASNYVTLMCGDGTNDVGALKAADVGVALLGGTKEDLEKIAQAMQLRRMQDMQKQQEEMMKRWGGQLPENVKAQQKQQLNHLMSQIGSPDDVPVLQFGDASVAAPFTSKIGSINSICEILRQGRCTLVTTIQMYKILALNCLITAFTLSALYLDGIKYGDTQMTLQGFLLAGCFLFLSWAKPIERLSAKRPLPNIFNLYIIGTVIGQFIVHAFSLWYIVVETKKLLPEDWQPDDETKEFKPNLLNTSVYLISLSMQVSTFLINYEGRPFRESLNENKPLYYSLLSLLGVAIFGAAQVHQPLNEWVQLVPMEPAFSDKLVMTILADIVICFGIEKILNHLFSNNKPKRSLDLHDY